MQYAVFSGALQTVVAYAFFLLYAVYTSWVNGSFYSTVCFMETLCNNVNFFVPNSYNSVAGLFLFSDGYRVRK